jgi:hypothetical protein
MTLATNPVPASTTYSLNPNSLVTTTINVPTFTYSPAWCTVTPLYTIVDTATSACTSWITCNPTVASGMVLGTTDWTKAGTYNMRVDFRETASDLSNSSVTFTVIIKIMNATSITMSTTPGN